MTKWSYDFHHVVDQGVTGLNGRSSRSSRTSSREKLFKVADLTDSVMNVTTPIEECVEAHTKKVHYNEPNFKGRNRSVENLAESSSRSSLRHNSMKSKETKA